MAEKIWLLVKLLYLLIAVFDIYYVYRIRKRMKELVHDIWGNTGVWLSIITAIIPLVNVYFLYSHTVIMNEEDEDFIDGFESMWNGDDN